MLRVGQTCHIAYTWAAASVKIHLELKELFCSFFLAPLKLIERPMKKVFWALIPWLSLMETGKSYVLFI